MRISDWSSDVCSSDLRAIRQGSDASSAGHVEYSVVEMETRAVRYGGAIDQSISSRESYDGIIFGGPSRRRDQGARTIIVRIMAGGHEVFERSRTTSRRPGATKRHEKKRASHRDRTSTRLNSSH